MAGQPADQEPASSQNSAILSNAENEPEHSAPSKTLSSTTLVQPSRPSGPAAQPSRIPMTGLSANSQYTPPAGIRRVPPVSHNTHSKIPERPVSYLASLRSNGNSTHRESRPTSPALWHSPVASGALTARGERRKCSGLTLKQHKTSCKCLVRQCMIRHCELCVKFTPVNFTVRG